jgi:hypothetical protein
VLNFDFIDNSDRSEVCVILTQQITKIKMLSQLNTRSRQG